MRQAQDVGMEWRTRGETSIGHASGVRYVVSQDVLGWYFSWEFDPSSLGAPGTVTCRFDTLELARDAAGEHWLTH